MSKVRIIRKTVEVLPAIEINIDIPPREFLENMSELAEESGGFELRSCCDGMRMDIVDFMPKEDLGHDDLYGQLIYEYKKDKQIRVEIRARAWNPEDVTREAYLQAAHHVFDGLIKQYNARYKRRHRMRIIKERTRDLPPKASEALDDFAFLANKTSLHPLDWRRLYKFVRVCHATRANPSKGLMRGILGKKGFDDNKAEYIADVASHLLDFMNYRS